MERERAALKRKRDAKSGAGSDALAGPPAKRHTAVAAQGIQRGPAATGMAAGTHKASADGNPAAQAATAGKVGRKAAAAAVTESAAAAAAAVEVSPTEERDALRGPKVKKARKGTVAPTTAAPSAGTAAELTHSAGARLGFYDPLHSEQPEFHLLNVCTLNLSLHLLLVLALR